MTRAPALATTRAPALAISVFILTVAGALAVASCAHPILASDFDQTCEADSDCVAVMVGEICDCICTVAAINKSDQSDYQAAIGAKACGDLCSPCGELPPAACEAKKCVVR